MLQQHGRCCIADTYISAASTASVLLCWHAGWGFLWGVQWDPTKLLHIAGVSTHEHARWPLPAHQHLPCQLASCLAPGKNVCKAQHPLHSSAIRFKLS